MIVQLLQLICVCSSRWMAVRAVATMVWSTETMNRPIETMAKIRFRRARGGPAWPGTVAAGGFTVISFT